MSGRPSLWTILGPRSGSSAMSGISRGFSGASGSMFRRPASSRRSSEGEMLYARISAERIGVLIGPEGTTKERLQKATGTRILVDSTTGEVTIDEADAQDPVMALKARDIIHAMARGFSEDRAFRLLDEDAYFEVFDIKDFAHSRNRVAQIRARLIGTRGKTRRLIEELTGVEVSVWGHTIALIGGTFEMAIAREAGVMLLRGSEHKTVYRFLERKRAGIKVYQMGVWTSGGPPHRPQS